MSRTIRLQNFSSAFAHNTEECTTREIHTPTFNVAVWSAILKALADTPPSVPIESLPDVLQAMDMIGEPAEIRLANLDILSILSIPLIKQLCTKAKHSWQLEGNLFDDKKTSPDLAVLAEQGILLTNPDGGLSLKKKRNTSQPQRSALFDFAPNFFFGSLG